LRKPVLFFELLPCSGAADHTLSTVVQAVRIVKSLQAPGYDAERVQQDPPVI
jgi:hypothetical protein